MPAREDADELAQPLAKGLAWDRRPEALDYFARVPSGALDDVGREWWARAAMWAGDWGEVRAAIAAMSPQRAGRLAVALLGRAGGRAARRKGYGAHALSRQRSAATTTTRRMAAARLGERVVPRLEPYTARCRGGRDDRRRRRVPARARARARRPARARNERVALRLCAAAGGPAAPGDPSRRALGDLRHRGRDGDEPWPLQRLHVALSAALRGRGCSGREIDEGRAGPALRRAAAREPVPPRCGVVGRRLRRRPADATPRRARRRAAGSCRRRQREDLFDPRVNITLGAARVAELLEQFDAQLPVALGAYNAGRGRRRTLAAAARRPTATSGSRTFLTTRRAPTCAACSGTASCSSGSKRGSRRARATGSARSRTRKPPIETGPGCRTLSSLVAGVFEHAVLRQELEAGLPAERAVAFGCHGSRERARVRRREVVRELACRRRSA